MNRIITTVSEDRRRTRNQQAYLSSSSYSVWEVEEVKTSYSRGGDPRKIHPVLNPRSENPSRNPKDGKGSEPSW
ncbi:MAG: hypothetical protein F6K58_22440 [Symploca sp. SIO2E9]|nr:hypothetical protein [Symploca sp. SIO2E9]